MPAEQKDAAAAQEAGSEEGASKSASSSSMPSNSLRNRAGESNSPYVRAHADTPVAWQLLDNGAIGRAKKENKLIFLNIGFRACHCALSVQPPSSHSPGLVEFNADVTGRPDCRLTTQDSFSNPAVANLLNESFIPIIVDREERPDIDAVYMNYIQAVNGAGGWPLNVFLTPELEPVFGGTYWPGPGTEHSRPAIGGATTAPGGRGAVSATAASSDTEDEDRLDFLVILKKLRKIWTEQETRCRKEAKEILLQLRDFAAEGTLGSRGVGTPAASGKVSAAEPVDTAQSGGTYVASLSEGLDIDLDQLEEAYSHIARTFDAVNGGFGIEPKFPTPSKLSFLLRLGQYPQAVRDVVGEKEVEHADFMARHTLRRIRDGGLRDHVGGGFARYSVTADWAMPHFEKMVADNALLLELYLDAWLSGAKEGKLSLDDEFADIVLELVDYLTNKPIHLADGGFASSEAADSYYRKGDQHMREGAYYLWTRKEFDAVVGKDDETERAATIAATYWNVLEHGNIPREQDPQDEFINQNVLHIVKDVAEISKQFGISEQQVKEVIAQARERLRAHREKERVRPETDEKLIAAYDGMVIGALSRAFGALQLLDAGRASRAFDAANEAAELLRKDYWDASAKVLYRTKDKDGKGTKGFADDYAFVIDGLLQLVELSPAQDRWLEWANELQGEFQSRVLELNS
jgi:uncharacterized protein YyaL (SSP411 family)